MNTPDCAETSWQVQRRTQGPEETEALGRSIGAMLHRGLWIALEGPLGSGKTVLARGILAGLGFEGRVRSPTYTLLQAYERGETRMPAYHVDLYRLAEPGEIWSLGLADLMGAEAVVIIEWADRLITQVEADQLRIGLAFSAQPEQRLLRMAATPGMPRTVLGQLREGGEVEPC